MFSDQPTPVSHLLMVEPQGVFFVLMELAHPPSVDGSRGLILGWPLNTHETKQDPMGLWAQKPFCSAFLTFPELQRAGSNSC